MGEIATGTTGVVFILFCIVMTVVWVLLPFAIFGTKSRLDAINDTNKEILAQLMLLNSHTDKADVPDDMPSVAPTTEVSTVKQPVPMPPADSLPRKVCQKCNHSNDGDRNTCIKCRVTIIT